MSKAFTSEETPEIAILGRPVQRAAPGHERPITQLGHAALVRRQRELLSDKSEQAMHDLALVEATLGSVRIVEVSPVLETVSFGHWVTYALNGGPAKQVRLAGPDETAANLGLVSVQSPLGRALIGLKVGDSFELVRPAAVDEGEVLSLALERTP